jgi:hypothetical protein
VHILLFKEGRLMSFQTSSMVFFWYMPFWGLVERCEEGVEDESVVKEEHLNLL